MSPLLSILAVLGVVAAGGAIPPSDRPAPASVDTTTITVYSYGSEMAFEPASVSAKEGTTVRIRYINEGTLPHNFVIVRDADDIGTLGSAAYDAGQTGFVPMAHKDKMIAYSGLASPGETVEFTFVAPPAGEYTFVCLVAGHYNMMLGKFRSRE